MATRHELREEVFAQKRAADGPTTHYPLFGLSSFSSFPLALLLLPAVL
jgi:hypothetical protein